MVTKQAPKNNIYYLCVLNINTKLSLGYFKSLYFHIKIESQDVQWSIQAQVHSKTQIPSFKLVQDWSWFKTGPGSRLVLVHDWSWFMTGLGLRLRRLKIQSLGSKKQQIYFYSIFTAVKGPVLQNSSGKLPLNSRQTLKKPSPQNHQF